MKSQTTIRRVLLLVFVFSTLGFMKPATMQAETCNHTIDLSVTEADARTNYPDVKPGHVVCLAAGTRGHLLLKNFEGTAENPIIFTNSGGQVIIDSEVNRGILIQNSRFFRLTGSGTTNINYGIKVIGSTGIGVDVGYRSSNFEVDHLEVTGVAGVGIFSNSPARCSDGSGNIYDYDGDGIMKGDLDDVVNRDSFTQNHSVFYNNYVHDVGTEGFYVGSSFYSGKNIDCDGGTETVYAPLLEGVKIYDNTVDITGWDGIQVGSAVSDCEIRHNEIYSDSQANEKNQQSGVMINKGSVCHVYDNHVEEGGGPGIYIQGNGNNKIYNNVIVKPGQNMTLGNNGGDGISIFGGSNPGNDIYVWNNTIVEPKNFGIKFEYKKDADNKIQNNLIVAPGNYSSYGENAYIQTWGKANVTISNNITSQDISEVNFTDPASNDYSLLSDSPAIDTGINLNSMGITTDYTGVLRPQGLEFDAGAFEGVSNAPTPEPTGEPTPEPNPNSIILTIDGPDHVSPGETVSINALAQNVPTPGLYGVQLEINYDPTLISAANLQVNPNLAFVVLNNADNTAGKIRLVASQQGQVPGLTGDVTLLSFEATAADTPGTVTFTFENEKMSDSQAQGFDIVGESYTLSIGETVTPEPTDEPSPEPTDDPTPEPTDTPIPTPTNTPTPEPTDEPTPEPTDEPTTEPTDEPTPEPTDEPTPEPTDEPAMANVSGQVILAGRAGNNWSEAVVTIDDNGQFGMTEMNGTFNIANVTTGLLGSITADAPGYLSAVCSEPMVTGPETVLTAVNLLSGDVNDDNLVDITDATAVGTTFDQTGLNLPADITRDDVVDIFDIVLVSVNFGEEGPQIWSCLGQ